MALKVGDNPVVEVYVGDQKVVAAYVGSTLVYEASSASAPASEEGTDASHGG